MFFNRFKSKSPDEVVIDQLSRDLDNIEKVTPMTDNYARVTPRIVEHEEAGTHFKFIIYHYESDAWFGTPQPDHAMIRVHETGLLKPNDVVFDLGCNSGYQTVWMGLRVPQGLVHSFDPYPWNAAATRANAALNGLSNVTVHAVGLGSADRSISTDSTSSKTFNTGEGRHGHSISIEVHRPDRYLKFSPSFVKIDIEGAEHELAGTSLMTHPTVKRGYVEMHPEFISAGGQDPAGFLNHLVSSGYSLEGHHRNVPLTTFDPVIPTGYYFSR